jgi:hypothetical protein
MNFSTDHDYSQLVSPESLERELKRARAAADGAAHSVFGSRSLTWQIDRESAIFFGAGRALLLQLGQRLGGRRDRAHSNAFADPILRAIKSDLRNTSGHIEPQCFCIYRSTRANRHIVVLVTTPP